MPQTPAPRPHLLSIAVSALAELAIRYLIRRMSRENPTRGAPRIVSELALLGHDVAERTVAKYMVGTRKPPSQTWRTFLDNHVPDTAPAAPARPAVLPPRLPLDRRSVTIESIEFIGSGRCVLILLGITGVIEW